MNSYRVAAVVVLLGSVPAAAAEPVDYFKQIKPILAERCFACHGALKSEGGLRLDAAPLIRQGGDSGQPIVAGRPGESLLIERVAAADIDERMPPEGKPLTAGQVELLRRWIGEGAVAPRDEATPADPRKHWAFQPPLARRPPKTSAAWVRNEIDRFIAAGHKQHQLVAVGPADRATLLRRVYLDLIGLPPTRDQLRTYLADHSANAYEHAVDRLLASRLYGQRWARHWMNVWRYSDPSGYGKEIRDSRQHVWRWRDWIVDSLNDDKPYDRMLVEMLAADEAVPGDSAAARATGFLARNWYKFNRNVWLDNIVEHSSKAFLGLTANCARCHDHKYDPIAQSEYYQLRSIFESHDVRDDALPGGNEMMVRAFDSHPDTPTYLFIQGDERQPDKQRRLSPAPPAVLGGKFQVKPIALPAAAYYPALRVVHHQAALATINARLAKAQAAVATSQSGLEQAKTKLAEFKPPKSASPANLAKPPANNAKPKPILTDEFADLDSDRWHVDGGEWSVANKRVIQRQGNTAQHRLVSTIDHPADFRVAVRLRITGGEMWRSVGIGFDGHGKAMNAVYLSAFGGGTKVQATLQNGAGGWSYPATGTRPHPIKLNQDYRLELRVRGRLLNVLLDDQLLLAFTLPANRAAGRISLWTFSATAEFDDFLLTTLPAGMTLKGNNSPVATTPMTKDKLQHGLADAHATVEITRQDLAAIESERASLVARYTAERLKHDLDQGNSKQAAARAAIAERRAAVAQARAELSRAALQVARLQRTLGPKNNDRVKAEKALDAARKKLAAAEKRSADGAADYQPLGPVHPLTSTGRRLAWARWVTARENPLAARVAVNHIWLRHFDQPLVERMFDFGLRSPRPRHADLLDWLAVRFVEQGWSMKQLHKLIVTSGAYRLASSPGGGNPESVRGDPDNLWYWRQNTRRMEAEVVRDSVLRIGGSLDVSEGGPPIDHTQGQTVPRRSMYFRQDKERQMVFLGLFDGAKVNECYRRRPTVAPQQALAMYNSRIADQQAGRIAARLKSADDAEFVTAAFETVLSRPPTKVERKECTDFLRDFGAPDRARRQLALVLLNHNDFVTIR